MYGLPPIQHALDGAEAGISECGKQRRLKATLDRCLCFDGPLEIVAFNQKLACCIMMGY